MRHASPLRGAALLCNIKITYATLEMLNNILVPMLKYTLKHRDIIVFKLVFAHFIAGWPLKVFHSSRTL